LLNSGRQNVEIASLACGTMYDVLEADYEDRKKVSFTGFDVDNESLRLVREKAEKLGYDNERINLRACDIVSTPLPEAQYDVIVCNGFSFYINDESLGQLIENVKRALKPNGILLMSFIQPPAAWQMSEEEKKVSTVVKEILDAVPMNWSANLRTGDQVLSLVKKSGLTDVSVLEEQHHIHPLILAHKSQ
jgi:SAM-dependent methyltransferase